MDDALAHRLETLDPETSSPIVAFHTKFCKRSRCLEENPVFVFLSKKINNEKEEFSPSMHVVFSIVDRSQFEI
jgi:hypothetical protein